MATSRESECAPASSSSSTDLDSSSESDVLEQSSVVEPYTNEPLASSGDEFEQTETDDEDGISTSVKLAPHSTTHSTTNSKTHSKNGTR